MEIIELQLPRVDHSFLIPKLFSFCFHCQKVIIKFILTLSLEIKKSDSSSVPSAVLLQFSERTHFHPSSLLIITQSEKEGEKKAQSGRRVLRVFFFCSTTIFCYSFSSRTKMCNLNGPLPHSEKCLGNATADYSTFCTTSAASRFSSPFITWTLSIFVQ